MKTKISLLIALCGFLTLSFTFTSVKHLVKPSKSEYTNKVHSEPTGGFISEDKF